MGADAADDMAENPRCLGAGRALAGPQQERHRFAGRRLVDVDGLETIAVGMAVEERKLLVAMSAIRCVVDVQHDLPRHDAEAVTEKIDQPEQPVDEVGVV
jgi:hypothetical protein